MPYLTLQELPLYDLPATTTLNEIQIASYIIDSYTNWLDGMIYIPSTPSIPGKMEKTDNIIVEDIATSNRTYRDRILLRNSPIREVKVLNEEGESLAARSLFENTIRIFHSTSIIRVEYLAGWKAEELPKNIKLACSFIIKDIQSAIVEGTFYMGTYAAGDTRISFPSKGPMNAYLSEATKDLLRFYRSRSYAWQ